MKPWNVVCARALHRARLSVATGSVCVCDAPVFCGNYLRSYHRICSQRREERSAQILRDHIGMFFQDICTRKRLLASMGHPQKWLFDEIQLVELFEASGFEQVARMTYHQSRIADVGLVERSDFLIVEMISVVLALSASSIFCVGSWIPINLSWNCPFGCGIVRFLIRPVKICVRNGTCAAVAHAKFSTIIVPRLRVLSRHIRL